jgi:hypothetical protein
MSDKLLNILLVEDDEVDVMNIRRAFKKGNISNPLFVAGTAWKRSRCCAAGAAAHPAPGSAGPEHAAHERHRVPARAARGP